MGVGWDRTSKGGVGPDPRARAAWAPTTTPTWQVSSCGKAGGMGTISTVQRAVVAQRAVTLMVVIGHSWSQRLQCTLQNIYLAPQLSIDV